MSTICHDWLRAGTLEAVLDFLPNPVLLYDANLKITGLNRAASQLLRRNGEEILGKSCREVFGCSDCAASCGIRAALDLEADEGDQRTVRIFIPGGMERLASVRTRRIRNADRETVGVAAVVEEVTEATAFRKQAVIAKSAVMRDLLRFITRVAASPTSTVLLEGESGTGKDLLAQRIHYESLRMAGPFIAVNCASIPESLLESELFGHERGAFTDARAQKRGIFELADGGTLFLDEIGEMPLTLQAKLLRVLEDHTFRRLGGLKDIQLDVRVIAATNQNLAEAVREGAFRQDLYYRLNVIQIPVPTLRSRKEDIPALAEYFVDLYNHQFRRHVEKISPEVLAAFQVYDWPGNVRELRNAIERAMILEESSILTAQHLPLALLDDRSEVSPSPMPWTDGVSLVIYERQLVEEALRRANGNQTQAARLLRITRDTLRYKLKKIRQSQAKELIMNTQNVSAPSVAAGL